MESESFLQKLPSKMRQMETDQNQSIGESETPLNTSSG